MSAALKDELVHGTITTYTYYGCRCKECRNAKRQYQATYRAQTENRYGKFQSKAKGHALQRLTEAHPAEFQRYYTEEKVALREARRTEDRMTHHLAHSGALFTLAWCAVAATGVLLLAYEEIKIDRRER